MRKFIQNSRRQQLLAWVGEAMSGCASIGKYPSQRLIMNSVGIKSKRTISEIFAAIRSPADPK